MNVFNILQILFDAVFIFGILFLFNYSVSQTQKKDDDREVLKSAHAEEIKEQLQELLLTLKQLGNEVSETIQKEVLIAEEKIDLLQKTIQKANKLTDKIRRKQSNGGIEKELKNAGEKVDSFPTLKEATKLNVKNYDQGSSKDRSNRIDNKILENKSSSIHGLSSELIREVYHLADSENDLKRICEKTNLSLAEIQLILNLRGNRFTTPN